MENPKPLYECLTSGTRAGNLPSLPFQGGTNFSWRHTTVAGVGPPGIPKSCTKDCWAGPNVETRCHACFKSCDVKLCDLWPAVVSVIRMEN